MAYLIDNVNKFKNKDVEQVVLANNLNDLFKIVDPYEQNLKSLVESTISNISDNLYYYNGNLQKIEVDKIQENLNLNKKELDSLNEAIENNDVKEFLKSFKEIIYTKARGKNIKKYDLAFDRHNILKILISWKKLWYDMVNISGWEPTI